jgi:hypothetical protein
MDDSIFVKVMHCKNPKDIWDKFKNIYEGDTKVKGAKIQTLIAKFEKPNMKEDENLQPIFYELMKQ